MQDNVRTTWLFFVRMWLGVRGKGLVGSSRLSQVKGREFTMFTDSYRKVRRDSSSNWELDSARRTVRTLRTLRICRSQIPPIWEADGTFILNCTQSHPWTSRNLDIFVCSIFLYSVQIQLQRLGSSYPDRFVVVSQGRVSISCA